MNQEKENIKKVPIRIALVEDHTIVRQALANLLAKNDRIAITIEAENGQDFLNQLAGKSSRTVKFIIN
jgi:DNA-binding NarL/FixJ family response regulator